MKKLLTYLLTIVLVFSPLLSTGYSLIAADARIEGDGTLDSPYLIRTVEQFNLMDTKNGLENASNSYFKLMNDLNFQNVIREPMEIYMVHLDGDNHVLRNLKVTGADYVGLFSNVEGSTIENLGIVGADISATGYYVGTLFATAGESDYSKAVTLKNCYVKNGKIFGRTYVGGIGGWLSPRSKVTDCYVSNCEITSKADAGGIIGGTLAADFTRCYSNAKIEGGNYVAGIAGITSSIVNNFEQCYSVSQLKGKKYVSGIVNHEGEQSEVLISECYFAGSIVADENGSGLAYILDSKNGYKYPPSIDIYRSYATGTIEAVNRYGLAYNSTHGYSGFTNSYFDYAGITEPKNNVRTKEQMFQKNNYVEWDFEKIWTMEEGSYPKLRFTPEENPVEPKTLKIILEVNEMLQLSIQDDLIENRELTWTSSDPNTISVNADGEVTAKADGTAVITASNSDNTYMEKIYVLILKSAKEYRLSVDLEVGKRCRLTIDDGVNNTACTWVSNDAAIASVDDKGVVTSKSKGLVLIQVKDEADEIIGQVYVRVR